MGSHRRHGEADGRHRRQGDADDKLYNVGVIGKSGSGKSSFINAFLGLPHHESYSAKADVVECTKEPHPYYLPDCQFVLWDVPGYGTTSMPYGEEYLKKINFTDYDFYMHVSSKLEETELQVHSAIAQQGKRYFYIRTKIDKDIRGQQKAYRRSFKEDIFKQGIVEKIHDCFPDVPVYLVNCLKSREHDMPSVQELTMDGIRFSLRSHEDVKRKSVTPEKPRGVFSAGCSVQ